jgi:integrase
VDRLRRTAPQRPTLDPEQPPTLLDSARRLQPILATLAGSGLRDGEACTLDWCDVNLATGTLTVRASKTDAGLRRVDLPLALREELGVHKARSARASADDPVFTNRNGRRETVSNIGRRLKTVLRRTDARLTELGLEPIGQA